MTAPDISAASIEAGAEALWNWTMNDDVAVDPEPWRLVDSEDRQRCTEAVRIILEAAVPVLLAEHREQIAREIEAYRADEKRWPLTAKEGFQRHAHGLDDAAAVARGSRPAADGGGGE